MTDAVLFGLFAFFAGIASERGSEAVRLAANLYIVAAFILVWAQGLFACNCN